MISFILCMLRSREKQSKIQAAKLRQENSQGSVFCEPPVEHAARKSPERHARQANGNAYER